MVVLWTEKNVLRTEYVRPSLTFIKIIKRVSSLLIMVRFVCGNNDKRKLNILKVTPVMSFNAFSDCIELNP
jgi:hypothetical protein